MDWISKWLTRSVVAIRAITDTHWRHSSVLTPSEIGNSSKVGQIWKKKPHAAVSTKVRGLIATDAFSIVIRLTVDAARLNFSKNKLNVLFSRKWKVPPASARTMKNDRWKSNPAASFPLTTHFQYLEESSWKSRNCSSNQDPMLTVITSDTHWLAHPSGSLGLNLNAPNVELSSHGEAGSVYKNFKSRKLK